jgi:hypothetical protein
MPRIRTIKPEFPQSESMGRVSRDARLLFVQLWTLCDDHGRTRAASRMLASLLFPYDDDAPSLIEGWLAELEAEGCIELYEHNGSRYLFVCNWLIHQKIDKPSRPQFPDPLECSRSLAKPREHSSLDQGPRTKEGTKDLSVSSLRSETASAIPPSEGEEPAEVNGKRKRATVPCPIERIADLWDEVLPEKHSVTLWTDARKASISARWREMAAFYGWQQQADGIEWFRKLFRKMRESEFLMGRAPPRSKDQRPFQLDMDWAFGPKNFTKIVEGKYHETARH